MFDECVYGPIGHIVIGGYYRIYIASVAQQFVHRMVSLQSIEVAINDERVINWYTTKA